MGFGFNKKLQIVKYKLCTNIYCELKITRDSQATPISVLQHFHPCNRKISSLQRYVFHPVYEMLPLPHPLTVIFMTIHPLYVPAVEQGPQIPPYSQTDRIRVSKEEKKVVA